MPDNLYLVFRYDETLSSYIYYTDTVYSVDYNYIKDGDVLTIMNSTQIISDDDSWVLEITKLTSTDFHYSATNRYEWEDWSGDTTFYDLSEGNAHFIKSELPSFTATQVNKKKPINGYNSFLHRRIK